jgi:hypothetical protein
MVHKEKKDLASPQVLAARLASRAGIGRQMEEAEQLHKLVVRQQLRTLWLQAQTRDYLQVGLSVTGLVNRQ